MPSFNYKAINEAGRRVSGTIYAENETDLETRIMQLKLELLAAKPVRSRKTSKRGRVGARDLIVLCMHLEQLERAGVPLLDALSDARETCDSNKLQDIMSVVYEDVKNGSMLSQALAVHPKVFNDVFVGLIAAGEKTGNMADAFAHLGEHLKWTADIRRKIKKATRYPKALVLVITLVISVIMLFVVPKLVDFIVAQGFSLPLHTRALIAVSYAFQYYWYVILGLPIALIVLMNVLYRTVERVSYKIDAITLKLPLIGPVVRKIDLARFTHFFSVMFNSGIDVLESLQGAGEVVHNRVLKESIILVRTHVSEGNSLMSSLRLSNQFPNLVVRMFKVGEDSGNMKEALDNVNFFYNREVNDSVDAMVGAIQPILTVVMGFVIFWVISAVFGPLYESMSKIKL